MSKSSIKLSSGDVAAVVSAISHTKIFFAKDRLVALAKQNFVSKFSIAWATGQIHGGIRQGQRGGVALLAQDMSSLPHGLHASQYAVLPVENVPTSELAVHTFIHDLVARNKGASLDQLAQVKAVISDGLECDPDSASSTRLDRHVQALWNLKKISEPLFIDAITGNIEQAIYKARQIPVSATRRQAITTIARQGIVWGSFDVHRIAARGRAARKSMVPFFLRPFMRTDTVNELMAIMEMMARLIVRMHKADDIARRYKREVVRLRGPDGEMLSAILPPARTFERDKNLHSHLNELDFLKPFIVRSAEDTIERCKAVRLNPSDEQRTLHQHNFAGLSEIAALAVTAIRYALAERQLQSLIRSPDTELDLQLLKERPVSEQLDPGVLDRAKAVVAAYRTAILCDVNANPEGNYSATNASDAFAEAQKFLKRFETPPASLRDRTVMYGVDLAHRVRCS